MLHLITEVGKPGKNEREKRHFPVLDNQPGQTIYHARGRRYIPHGYGNEFEFVPHPQHLEPDYTENGPDWNSRLRYIPSPHNPEYITEIWPEPWKALRTFPWMSRRTEKEWALHPEGLDTAVRSRWGGEHKATSTSTKEVTHSQRFGKGRIVIDKRNGISMAAPGDKSYQVVEYSPNFHKMGCTLPIVNFGGSGRRKPDTFVPLQELPRIERLTWSERERQREQGEEKEEVATLERWEAASPLLPPPHAQLHPPLPVPPQLADKVVKDAQDGGGGAIKT